LSKESIGLIANNCNELREINLGSTNLSEDAIEILVNNLTTKIEKLSLGWERSLKDEHVMVLVSRYMVD